MFIYGGVNGFHYRRYLLLMCFLYFILFYLFYFTYEQLHNVALAIDLMRDSGMKFQAKPEGEGSKNRLR